MKVMYKFYCASHSGKRTLNNQNDDSVRALQSGGHVVRSTHFGTLGILACQLGNPRSGGLQSPVTDIGTGYVLTRTWSRQSGTYKMDSALPRFQFGSWICTNSRMGLALWMPTPATCNHALPILVLDRHSRPRCSLQL